MLYLDASLGDRFGGDAFKEYGLCEPLFSGKYRPMESPHHHQLRAALNILGWTATGLANKLTAIRTDGKTTTRAAVSSWMNGKRPVPAPLQLHVRDALITQIRSNPPGLGGLKVVTVGGGKGGAGASPMTTLLAAAAKKLGYHARIGSTEGIGCGLEYWASDFVSPFRGILQVRPEAIGKVRDELKNEDILFIDVGSASMVNDLLLDRFELNQIDLAVVPFNPFDHFDCGSGLKVAMALRNACFTSLLMQPVVCRTSVSIIQERGFDHRILDEVREHISEQTVFKRTDIKRPGGWLNSSEYFQDDDLESEYAGVLREVLKRLGVDEDRLELQPSQLEGLSLNELISLAGAGKAARRISDTQLTPRLETAWLTVTK